MIRIPRRKFAIAALASGTCAFFSAGLTRALLEKGLGSSDFAGWVQALGATIGIGIAIWVPYKQHKDAQTAELDRQRENAMRVCAALKDELLLMRAGFEGELFQEMLKDAPEEAFNLELPKAENPHPVYDALVGKIVDIDDSATRQAVIRAYGASSHLQSLLILNTEYLAKYSQVVRENADRSKTAGVIGRAIKEANARARLLSLRSQLKEAADLLVQRCERAIALLEGAETDSSPRS